jgi:hypothetical protein
MPLLTPAAADLERRRPVWLALSELFLDTDLDEPALERIARALRVSGYAPDELERILDREVAPILNANLRIVAGQWEGFDPDRLAERILERQRSWRRWLPSVAAGPARETWRRVRKLMTQSTVV